ncbi:hypothetical protein [Flavobacterium sp. J27]|uniref:hypothetical protein n=1 Tax=Flavobacterium sp. J27 TaxID=2060419 RepID=UPI0010305BD2|nr:hypothetical protein [Flavobacterium sp. J27]
MNKLSFLVVGKNDEIIQVLKRVIQSNFNSKAITANDMDEFYKTVLSTQVNVVLLSCGLEIKEEQEIKRFINSYNPNIKVIEHYGGGSGLLKSEVLIQFPNL